METTEQLKEWRGLYFPQGETHQTQWMARNQAVVDGKPAYQYHKYRAAKNICKKFDVAIDVGANVGLWSRVMCLDFKTVYAFEPVPMYIKCLELNAPRAIIKPVGLGKVHEIVDMACRTEGSFGDTGPVSGRQGEFVVAKGVEIVSLDSLEITGVDFIKIDCEGFESFVIQGAEQTIKDSKPVILVEQKKGNGKAYNLPDDHAVQLLIGYGMRLEREISGDYLMVW